MSLQHIACKVKEHGKRQYKFTAQHCANGTNQVKRLDFNSSCSLTNSALSARTTFSSTISFWVFLTLVTASNLLLFLTPNEFMLELHHSHDVVHGVILCTQNHQVSLWQVCHPNYLWLARKYRDRLGVVPSSTHHPREIWVQAIPTWTYTLLLQGGGWYYTYKYLYRWLSLCLLGHQVILQDSGSHGEMCQCHHTRKSHPQVSWSAYHSISLQD